MTLCECMCGGNTVGDNKFIRFHHLRKFNVKGRVSPMKGKKNPSVIEHARQLGFKNRGRKWNDDSKRKMIGNQNGIGNKSRTGQVSSPETKQKCKDSWYYNNGNKHFEEQLLLKSGLAILNKIARNIATSKKLCKCGCRQLVESYNAKYIHGHNKQFSDTEIEMILQKKLNEKHIEFIKNYKFIGLPDIAFPEKKIAIFADGCYWHSCDQCKLVSIKKNVKHHDQIINTAILKKRWKVLRYWEHDIKTHPDRIVNEIVNAYNGG